MLVDEVAFVSSSRDSPMSHGGLDVVRTGSIVELVDDDQ